MKVPEQIKGAVFDVDDTLLNNQPAWICKGTIQDMTRLQAIHQVAERHDLPGLRSLTEEENLEMFDRAKVHSLAGAVRQILSEKQIIAEDTPLNHPLITEIVAAKDELHLDVLRKFGRAVSGVDQLLHTLGNEQNSPLAIASSGIRRDINYFLDTITSFRQFFPNERVISLESVRPGYTKPHSEPFDRAFGTLGLPDEQRKNTLAFEDDPRGIISARKAGLFTCFITTRFSADDPMVKAAQPDLTFRTYEEFMAEYLQK